MTTKTTYIASDRREFGTAAECEAHEREVDLARKREQNMKGYVASDYAGLKLPNGASFYYGYEVTASNNEWCFRVSWRDKNGKLQNVIIPFSEIGARDQYDPGECLLEGVAKLFERGIVGFM